MDIKEEFRNWVKKELNEMSPVRMSGNAPFESLDNESKSLSAMTDDFFEIGKINSNVVFKHKKFNIIKVARIYFDEIRQKERWAIIAELSFNSIKVKSDNRLINKKDAIKISSINVREANRRDGIASKLYILLLNLGYIVISDGVQYEGAIKLWKSFIEIQGIKVYIWDEMEDKIISKMTSKTHDNSIWSDGTLNNYSKMRVKLILSLI